MDYKILKQDAFWTVNKSLSKLVGIEAALFLSALIGKMEYFYEKGCCIEIGGLNYFYYTAESIENETTLSYSAQKRVIKVLEKEGFISTKLMGVPAKLHFAIIENKISSFLNTGFSETAKLYIKDYSIKNKDKDINRGDFILFDKVCSYFDEKAYSGTKIQKWLDCYDKLIRLDGYSEEQILEIVKEFRRQGNWWMDNGNFESLLKLRKESKEGLQYAYIFSQKLPKKTPNNLGDGEYLDQSGNRTYGEGKAIVPKDAPPRPSNQYFWSKLEQKWKTQ